MKFVFLPLVALFSLLSFSTALPIELQGLRARQDFDVRLDEEYSPALVSPLDKRDNALLTSFFTSLNKTGTGITLVKAAIRTPGINDQIVKFIANLVEEKNLTYLLQVADESGLALDLVLLILTHYEVIDGLTDFVKYYKGDSNSTSSGSSSGGGLLGGLLGGIGSIFGIGGGRSGSSNSTSSGSGGGLISGLLGGLTGGSSGSRSGSGSSNSTSGSGGGLLGGLLNGLTGGSSSSPTSSSPSTSTGSSSGGSSGGLVSGLLGNLLGGGSRSGSGSSSASSAPAGALGSAAPTASAPAAGASPTSSRSGGLLGGLLGGLGGASSKTSSAAGSPAATSAPAAAGAPAAASADPIDLGDAATSAAPADPAGSAVPTGTASPSTPSGGVSSLVEGLGSLFKREDVEEFVHDEELLKRHADAMTEQLQEIVKRSEGLSELEKRDIWDSVYQQMIRLIGTDSNVEEIAESLQKSGLAINVIYNALTDSDWFGFDKKLVKYLVDNNIVTFSILLNSLLKSGVIWSVAADIIGNSSYVKLVIDFVIAIFTGKVNVIGLIMALF